MKTSIPKRQRCGALVRYRSKKMEQYQLGLIEKAEVLRVVRRSEHCQNWALPGSRRCRLHGGLSTGARTPEGKLRQAEARRRWLERLRAEGRKPGPPKGSGGRPKGFRHPTPDVKAERQVIEADKRLARARLLLRHAILSGPDQRRRRWEARQEVECEVRRLLHEHQADRGAMRMPPLSAEALDRITESFRQRVTARMPTAASVHEASVRDLQDRVRDAEDALERAEADAAQVTARTPTRRSTTVAATEAPAA
jgi:hypothetical protein